MALLGKSSYLKTVELFLTHWADANAQLGSDGPLVIRLDDGSTINLPALRLRRDELKSSLEELQEKINESTISSQTLALAKRAILFRVRSLGWVLEDTLNNHPDRTALAKIPGIHTERAEFLNVLRRYELLWGKLNPPFGNPLLLAGKYSLEDYREEIGNLETVWIDADTTLMVKNIAEEEREILLHSVPRILVQYKQRIRSTFPADSKLVASLPPLYLAPGTIPKPVQASGIWDLEKEMGKISWEASDETEPFRYEVRYSPGERYDEDVESTIAVASRTAPAHWLTLTGLREKGRTALFRVYVVLNSGNESASNTVAIINGADDE